jgi:GDP-L-fucose synthase
MASGSMHVMNLSKNDYINNTSVMQSHINIGYGSDITVYDLALLIKKVVGYEGDILLDKDKSDGTPKKILDSSKLNSLGWSPEYDLEEGLKLTYENFTKSYDILRES